MKIVLAGGTGQLGISLARHFVGAGHEVVILGRSGPRTIELGQLNVGQASVEVVHWDAQVLGDWVCYLEWANVVIGLAGRTVNCRYTQENLDEMLQSRVRSAAVVGEAIEQAQTPPHTWLQMSTATIYAHRFDAANDDEHGIIGGEEPDVPAYWKTSVDIATAWEDALMRRALPHTRRVALRSTLVLTPDEGGIFDTLLGLVRAGLGGTIAGGRQMVSWIHEDDFVRSIDFLIERDDIDGPIIIGAPGALPQAEFMGGLRNAARVSIGLPATAWMAKIGAVFMRTDAELILKSRYVHPSRLLAEGFEFSFPKWEHAAADLFRSANGCVGL